MSQGSKSSRSFARRSGRVLMAGPLVTVMCVPALAGPKGERVVAGHADFERHGNKLVIRAADNTIINYTDFSIGSGQTVRFIQPGEASRVLNRVDAPNPSRIDGALLANGQVFIVNPAGVYFGHGALVDVGGIYAAAGNMSDADFLAGRDLFTSLEGEVINHGHIRGDAVHLMGASVANFGSVVAPEGVVTMVAGDSVMIGERGGHVFVRMEGSPGARGGVDQGGLIDAPGGQALIGAGDYFGLALHDTSELYARRVTVESGEGTVASLSGTIDASDTGRGGEGGTVHLLGERLSLSGLEVDASGRRAGGEILVGGDLQGQGEVRNAHRTYVDGETLLRADATGRGDGGRIIVWADEVTGFAGHASVRGGDVVGDGGFVEISGKEWLLYRGTVDLGVTRGTTGTLLLDPRDITIADGPSAPDDGLLPTILFGDPDPTTDITISEGALEAINGSVLLQANRDIILQDLSDGELSMQASAGQSVEFEALRHIVFDNVSNTISTDGGDIVFIAGENMTLGALTTNGGEVNLDAGGTISLGNITTGGGNAMLIANNGFTLRGTTSVDTTGGMDGVITFGGAIDSEGSDFFSLNLDSGIRAIHLDGVVGGNQRLRTLTASGHRITVPHSVNTTGDQTYNASTEVEFGLVSADHTISGEAGVTNGFRVLGDTRLQSDTSITTDGAQVRFTGSINGHGGDLWDLNVNAGTSNVTLEGLVGSTNALDRLLLTGGVVSVRSSVTTAGDQIYSPSTRVEFGQTSGDLIVTGAGTVDEGFRVNGTTRLVGDTSVTMQGTTADDRIRFEGAINGDTADTRTLTLETDTAASILLGGAVGGQQRLEGLVIEDTGGFTAEQNVTVQGLTQNAGSGTTLFEGEVSVADAIDLTGESYTFEDDVTVGGTASVEHTGTFEIGADSTFASSGTFTQTGAGTTRVLGTLRTTDQNISIAGPAEVLGGEIDAGEAQIAFDGTFSGGASLAILTADEVRFGDAATGTGVLIVRPSSDSRDFYVGNAPSGSEAHLLDDASIANIGDGFNPLRIGWSSASHAITLDDPAAFASATEFRSQASGGSITVRGSVTGGANGALSFLTPETITDGTVTINSAGNDLFFDGLLRVGEGGTAGIESNDGNLTISGGITGTAGGAEEIVSITAGTGDIEIGGLISGAGGVSDDTGLTTVTIVSGGSASLQGVAITGDLTTSNRIGGLFTMNGESLLAGAVNLELTDAAFGAVETTDGGFAVDNAGLLELLGDLDLQGGFSQVSGGPGSIVELSGDIDTNDEGPIEFASPVTLVAGPRELNAATDTITFGDDLTTGGFDLTLIAGSLSFGGGVDGGGTLTLAPSDDATPIDVGDVSGAGGTPQGGFEVTQAELNAIGTGVDLIRIGRINTGEHAIQIGTSAFQSAAEFLAESGVGLIHVLGTLAGTDDTAFRMVSATESILSGIISTQGGDIRIESDVRIADGASAFLDTGGGAGDVVIQGPLYGSSGGSSESVTLSAGEGDVEVTGLISGLADGSADAAGLVDVTIGTGEDVTLAGGVNITGELAGSDPLTGALTTAGSAITAGSIALEGVDFEFADVTTTDGGFSVDNSGLLRLNGDLTLAGAFAQNSSAGTGSVELDGDLTTDDADIDFTSGVTLISGPRQIEAGTGAVSFAQTLALAGSDLAIFADGINFNGGNFSVTGFGSTLTLAPSDAAIPIDVGGVSDPQSGALVLDSGDVGALAQSLEQVIIGRESASHSIAIGTATARPSLLFRADDGGSIQLEGTVRLLGPGAALDLMASAVQLGGTVLTTGGDVTVGGPAALFAATQIDTGGSGGDVTFNSTTDLVGESLVVSAGDGAVLFDDAVDSSEEGGRLSVSGQAVTLGDVREDLGGSVDELEANASGVLTLAGETYTADKQDFTSGDETRITSAAASFTAGSGTTAFRGGGIVLEDGADLSLTTDNGAVLIESGIESTDGATGSANVVIDAGSAAVLMESDIGATHAVGEVDISGGEVRLHSVRSIGSQRFAGSDIRIRGTYETLTAGDGQILFQGPVQIQEATTVTTAGDEGDFIRITGTLNGAEQFSANAGQGAVELIGDIGVNTPLERLTVAGGDVTLGAIGTSEARGVSGAVEVDAAGELVFSGGTYFAASQSYTAAEGMDLDGGPTLFQTNGGDILFSGGRMRLLPAGNLTVMSEGGDIRLTDLTGNSGEDLIVDAGSGSLRLGEVGESAGEFDLIELTADRIDLEGDVYGREILFQPSTGDLAVAVGGTGTAEGLSLSAAEILFLQNGFEQITIGREDGAHTMTIQEVTFLDPVTFRARGDGGSITVNGRLGGDNNASITLLGSGATTFLGADIVTDGNDILIEDAVQIGADVLLDTGTENGGNITIEGPGTIDAVSSDLSLTMQAGIGTVKIGGDIGAQTALGSLTIDSFANQIDGSVHTTGSQSYSGALLLGGDLRSTSAGTILITDGLILSQDLEIVTAGSASDEVVISGDIDSVTPTPRALSINAGGAEVSLEGNAGLNTALSTLTVEGTLISLQSVRTEGAQTYLGATALDGDLLVTESGSVLLDGPVTLTGNALISSQGDDGDETLRISGPVNGTLNLTLDVGQGDIVFGGGVGPTTRLNHLQIVSARDITAPSIRARRFTVQAATGQTRINGQVNTNQSDGIDLTGFEFIFNGDVLATNGRILINAADVRFNSAARAGSGGISLITSTGRINGQIQTTGDGEVVINNSGRFRLSPNVSLDLGGDFVQEGDGPTRIASDLVNPGNAIEFAGPLRLGNNLLIRGSEITLGGIVNSVGGEARRLTLGSGGRITIGGNVGGNNRLQSLQTSSFGAGANTLISANINTIGRQDYDTRVFIAGDSILRAGEEVRFRSLLDSSSNEVGNLTVVTDVTRTGRQLPRIVFESDIGSSNELGTLLLNIDQANNIDGRDLSGGQGSTPLVATIVGNEGMEVNAETFRMGRGEKFTVLGDLTINAADEAQLADLSVDGNLTVNSPSIVLRQRRAGNLLVKLEAADAVVVDSDQGADIVVAGDIDFSSTPSLEPGAEGQFIFATPDGRANVSGTLEDFSVLLFEGLGSDRFTLGDEVLDLRAQGNSSENLSEALAAAMPRADQAGQIGADTAVGTQQRESLSEIGITLRDADPQTLLDRLVGRGLYNDLPIGLEDDARVTAGRLDFQVVDRVVQRYRDLFLRRQTDPETGETVRDPDTGRVVFENRSEELRSVLGEAFEAYNAERGDRPFNGGEFRRFTETEREHAEAATVLNEMERLLADMRLLGLSPREYSTARSVLLSYIQPEGMSQSQLQEAIVVENSAGRQAAR